MTFGHHPRLAASPFEMSELESLVKHPWCVGVKECGVDFSGPNPANFDQQMRLFCRQVRVAAKFAKPLVLHIRLGGESSFLGCVLQSEFFILAILYMYIVL